MKIALLNDTHFGCRNDSPAFIEYQNRFYNEVFFPYIRENNINTLIHLGDVVDRRKFINHNTAHNFKNNFWKRLEEYNIDTHIIIGNHDTYYKNTNEVNALQNLNINKNAKIYTAATDVTIDGLDILFLPWICDDNYDDSLYSIDNSTTTVAMGHLEVKGFEMHKGHFNDHGLEKTQFNKFEKEKFLPLFYLVQILDEFSLKNLKFSKSEISKISLLRKWNLLLKVQNIYEFNERERFDLHQELETILPSFILFLPKSFYINWLTRWRDKDDKLFHPSNLIKGNVLKKYLKIQDGPILGKVIHYLSMELAYNRLNNFDEAIYKGKQWIQQNAPKCD